VHDLSLKTYASQACRIYWSNGTQETEQRIAIYPALEIIISLVAFHELANSFREGVITNVLKRGFLGLAVNKVALVAYCKYRSRGLDTLRHLGAGKGVFSIENCRAFCLELFIDSEAGCVDRLLVYVADLLVRTVLVLT
jgi:hypothetical protein